MSLTTFSHRPVGFKPITRMRGFSMLEVLIAFFVLSIGMLGVAGLQVAAARFNNDAKVRTQATLAINNVVNQIQARAFENDTWGGRNDLINQYQSTAPAGICDPTLSDVATDLACLNRAIDDQLPNATTSITNNGNRTMTIAVEWYNRELERNITNDWIIRF